MKTKGDGSVGIEVSNCTYSRLKAEMQTRVKGDGLLQDNHESFYRKKFFLQFCFLLLTFVPAKTFISMN